MQAPAVALGLLSQGDRRRGSVRPAPSAPAGVLEAFAHFALDLLPGVVAGPAGLTELGLDLFEGLAGVALVDRGAVAGAEVGLHLLELPARWWLALAVGFLVGGTSLVVVLVHLDPLLADGVGDLLRLGGAGLVDHDFAGDDGLLVG